MNHRSSVQRRMPTAHLLSVRRGRSWRREPCAEDRVFVTTATRRCSSLPSRIVVRVILWSGAAPQFVFHFAHSCRFQGPTRAVHPSQAPRAQYDGSDFASASSRSRGRRRAMCRSTSSSNTRGNGGSVGQRDNRVHLATCAWRRKQRYERSKNL